MQWENSLLLPGCAGMPVNVGLAGAYSGIVEGKLLVLGGANFPDRYPWEGGTKTWWSALYSYDLDTKNWSVYDDFLDRPLAYGVSIIHLCRFRWLMQRGLFVVTVFILLGGRSLW